MTEVPGKIEEAQQARLASFAAQAESFLSLLVDPQRLSLRGQIFLSLRPRDEDYAQVFTAAHVERARAGYAELWQLLPAIPLKPTHTQLRIGVALAEDFATGHARAQRFPGGYREVGHALVPGRPWAVWEIIETGERDGLLFDGLVGLADRLVWFPKPWRVLGESP